MGNFKGTKGKWDYEVVRNSTCRIHVSDEGFAEVYLPFNADDTSEMEANALLISKAPEMLEMLEKILKESEAGFLPHNELIKQLIKEATEI